MIDSGIDADHPAVGGRVEYAAIVEDGGELRVDTQPHGDDFGHGTACAGIIRALAPDCELTSVKVLGADLTGRGAVFAAGLRWAIENGMQVCNLSLGTTKRDFYAAPARARRRGVLRQHHARHGGEQPCRCRASRPPTPR